jgi:hypothetical protein
MSVLFHAGCPWRGVAEVRLYLRSYLIKSCLSRMLRITTLVTHVFRHTLFVPENVCSELVRRVGLDTVSNRVINPTFLTPSSVGTKVAAF